MFDNVTDEINHKKWLAGVGTVIGDYLRLATNEKFHKTPWYISIFINFLLIISVQRGHGDDIKFHPRSFQSGEQQQNASPKKNMLTSDNLPSSLGVHILGALLLVANVSVLVSAVVLHGPLLWLRSTRRVKSEQIQHDANGPVRFSTRRRIIINAFFPPIVYVIVIVVGTQLVYLTNAHERSEALEYFLRFAAFLLMFPFATAFHDVLSVRPWVLNPVSRIFVFVYDLCMLSEFKWKLILTIINVSLLSHHYFCN